MFGLGIIVIAVIIVIAFSVILICPSRTLDISNSAGVKVGIGTLVGMRLRRVSPRKVMVH